jgi:hypothetical protein
MTEPSRDRDTRAPQNPPNSVVNPDARRKAFHSFFTPLVLFFVVIGVALIYWASRPERPAGDREDRDNQETAPTTGTTPPVADSPGGHNPDPNPSSARDEIETRTGEPITELHGVFEERVGENNGRRVEIDGVTVERVESPTLFWVRDGNARVPVIAPADGPQVKQGQTIDLAGSVQRLGTELRIRATRVEVKS